MFAPAAPAKPIVPNRRRTNRGRHACVTFKWPSPTEGGAFVPNIFFFFYQALEGIRKVASISYCGRRGSCCSLRVITDHTWSYSTASPKPRIPVPGQRSQCPRLCPLQPAHKELLQAFCWGPFTVLEPLSCRSGAPCLRSTPSALFVLPTICHQQAFQKCNEYRPVC